MHLPSHCGGTAEMNNGYFVMGQYTSVAWFLKKEDAIKLANRLNIFGGTWYYVKEDN
jgi:hypothetical protein